MATIFKQKPEKKCNESRIWDRKQFFEKLLLCGRKITGTHNRHNPYDVAFACVSVFRDEKSRASLFANHSLMMINEQPACISFYVYVT